MTACVRKQAASIELTYQPGGCGHSFRPAGIAAVYYLLVLEHLALRRLADVDHRLQAQGTRLQLRTRQQGNVHDRCVRRAGSAARGPQLAP